ncbi:hypothetical protein NECAME_14787 [Necator americanus]|uniref:Uncharacterized protein n=1 Tax=Necator americanus TaxID=51031 RepID=W2SNI8_NECAM|nr:hypothetical protein NECAME_14787 [Necator americanus]ETN70416.1 hypothetical protein NECAME_14787 [Necator americanus]
MDTCFAVECCGSAPLPLACCPPPPPPKPCCQPAFGPCCPATPTCCPKPCCRGRRPEFEEYEEDGGNGFGEQIVIAVDLAATIRIHPVAINKSLAVHRSRHRCHAALHYKRRIVSLECRLV